ncbi:Trans-resveratrol di-O-methyltransferase [Linum grandiflorum]
MDLLDTEPQLWNHSFGYVKSMTVQCAVELGIPDVIQSHGRPITLVDLVAGLGIRPAKAPFVSRLLRMLTHLGYLTVQEEEGEERFSLTRLSSLLVKENPFNSRAFVLTATEPIMMNPWHHMSAWFRSSGDDKDDPFAFSHGGKKVYQLAAENPRLAEMINETFLGDSLLLGKVLVTKFRSSFEGLTSLVDVGGNTGTTAKAIAEAFPDIKCTVFDLPHVISSTPSGKFGNLNYVGGDMFEGIPSADAWVLLDWSDESCLKILKQCKKSVTSTKNPAGKVMIIDHVLDHESCRDGASTETLLLFDLVTMGATEGTARTEQQWRELFREAGFSDYRISPLCGLRAFIQVFP